MHTDSRVSGYIYPLLRVQIDCVIANKYLSTLITKKVRKKEREGGERERRRKERERGGERRREEREKESNDHRFLH